MLQNLETMLGGQQGQELQEFINRYHSGAPTEGIEPGEAVSRYQQLAPRLSPQDHQQAAEQALLRLSPEERGQFGGLLTRAASAAGVSLPTPGTGNLDNAGVLAQLATAVHSQAPGSLANLLDGSQGGVASNPVVKAVLAGIVSYGAQRLMGSR